MLFDQIQADLKVAMKSGDALKLSVLRMLSSELAYKKIDVQKDLNDEEVLGVVQKEAKKRREAIEAFGKAGRAESVTKEQDELKILSIYLPVQLTDEEVAEEVKKLLSQGSIADFGQAMRVVSPALKGKADGAQVARIVKEFLAPEA